MSASDVESEERVQVVTNDDGTVQIEGSDLRYAKEKTSITFLARQLDRVRRGYSRWSGKEQMARIDFISCDGASIDGRDKLGILGTERLVSDVDIVIHRYDPGTVSTGSQQPRAEGLDKETLADDEPDSGWAGSIGYFEQRFYCSVYVPAEHFEALLARHETGKPFTLYLRVKGVFWLRSHDRWVREWGVGHLLAPDQDGRIDFPESTRVDVHALLWEDSSPKLGLEPEEVAPRRDDEERPSQKAGDASLRELQTLRASVEKLAAKVTPIAWAIAAVAVVLLARR